MRGDEQAFADIFRELHPGLLRYVRGRFGGPADDVAGETWSAVARDMHRFRGSFADFRAWVFTIARARAIDELRRVRNRPIPAAELPESELIPTAEATVLQRQSDRDVLALVRRLPPDQADAVAARVLAGLDVAETAQLLDKSPEAIRVNTHRGLRRLATLVAEAHSTAVAG